MLTSCCAAHTFLFSLAILSHLIKYIFDHVISNSRRKKILILKLLKNISYDVIYLRLQTILCKCGVFHSEFVISAILNNMLKQPYFLI